MPLELDPTQLQAVRNMHNGCILKGSVGSGKSVTALYYYWIREVGGGVTVNGQGSWAAARAPKDLYIITTAKKRDSLEWQKELSQFGLSPDGTSVKQDIKVTIDSWNNIDSYKEVADAFFILDEQRLVGSGAWVKAFYAIAKKNRWVILSATPGDNWMDFVPVFVARGFYKNRTEFLRRHVVYSNFSQFPKIDHYVEVPVLEQLRASVLVDMPYERHTNRHLNNVLVNYDKDKFDKVWRERWNVYEDKPVKDIQQMFGLARRVVNTDPDRSAALMQLMEKHPKLIVFYNFNYELEQLKVVGTSTMYHWAQWNGHKHEEIPDADRWLYFVQYTAGAEGWNCTATDAMVFWSLNYSYKVNEQARGRIDRRNTPFTDLYYYVFRSASPIDGAIQKAITMKKNFSESKFIKAVFGLAA